MKTKRKGNDQPIKKSKPLSRQLTNNELIKMLKKFPGDAPIWSEGCDCYGVVNGVKSGKPCDDGILITRNN